MKRLLLLTLMLAAILFTGCGKQTEKKITFSDTGIQSDVVGVAINGTTLTIRAAGTYVLTGSCKDGNIIIDAPNGKSVNLVLDNLSLTCTTTAPIHVKDCPLLAITIAERSQNIITDRHTYSEMLSQDGQAKDASELEEVPNAAVFSKCPLLIRGEGEGQLIINADCYNGITTSDTLNIEGGVLNITAKNNALRGKDFVSISGGVITIKADNDGIKSTNTENAGLGYITIKGGVINIQADDEGIYAPRSVNFTGGTVTIKSKNTSIKTEGTVNFDAGIITVTSKKDDPIMADKQLHKSDALVTVNGKVLE
ncbi:MAG: carbohydrate-binding domain-containing protein [Lachnospiraceae bacterium]|nr:carbohydrate-binding domain-containing protein [Lachnospiraceae bacterium]